MVISLNLKTYEPEFGLSGKSKLSLKSRKLEGIGFLNIIFNRGLLWEKGVGGNSSHNVEQEAAEGAVTGVFYLADVFQLIVDGFYHRFVF